MENTYVRLNHCQNVNVKIWLVLSQGFTVYMCQSISIVRYDIEINLSSAGLLKEPQ